MQHKALGRGLDALLQPTLSNPAAGEAVSKLPVDKIRPNRYQPRTRFSEAALQELSESIRVHGLAQPLLVSPSAVPGEFELVAGERRLRAARLAGLAEVPCVVRTVNDRERHELSLIENIQREDLNPIEEAESIRKLMAEFSLTQEDVARTLGRSRSAVANRLRLLDLPGPVREAVMEGQLSEGHARALLGLAEKDQTELGERILREKLTVRDVERIVADWQTATRDGRVRPAKRKNADVRHLEEELQRSLGRRVQIQSQGKSRGWVRLEFYSVDDLQTLIQQLRAPKNTRKT